MQLLCTEVGGRIYTEFDWSETCLISNQIYYMYDSKGESHTLIHSNVIMAQKTLTVLLSAVISNSISDIHCAPII